MISLSAQRSGILRRYVKPYAWRLTGVYFWLIALSAIFGFYDTIANLERSVLDGLVAALRSVGFEPVNAGYLGAVIRILWVLIITAARPRELLGLSVYVLTFPAWVVGLFLFKLFLRFYEQYRPGSTLTDVRDTEQERRFRPLVLCTALLGAWFVLYGGAKEWQQVIPGIVLSGIILSMLAFRLFLRVRPTAGDGVGRFRWLVKVSERAVTSYASEEGEEEIDQGTAIGQLVVLRINRRLAHYFAKFLRGRRAQERVTFLIFAEYIVSLVAVAVAAIFFWALIISVAGSEPVPLIDSLRRSAAYFFPGIEPSRVGIRIPYWVTIGAAATGWVLFVLYIGPAGSVLPERQRATLVELQNAYHAVRSQVLALSRAIRVRERGLASISEQQ